MKYLLVSREKLINVEKEKGRGENWETVLIIIINIINIFV